MRACLHYHKGDQWKYHVFDGRRDLESAIDEEHPASEPRHASNETITESLPISQDQRAPNTYTPISE